MNINNTPTENVIGLLTSEVIESLFFLFVICFCNVITFMYQNMYQNINVLMYQSYY